MSSSSKTVVLKEMLPIQLTPEDRMARADDLANAVQMVETANARKRTTMKQLNTEVDAAVSRREELADIVASGKEWHEINVHQVFDYKTGKVTETRTDTKEVLRTRDMTDEEKQTSMLEDEPDD